MNPQVTWSARHHEKRALSAPFRILRERLGESARARAAVRFAALFSAGLLVGAALSLALYVTAPRIESAQTWNQPRGQTANLGGSVTACVERLDRLNTAIEAHYYSAGSWPESLADLIPGEMASLPDCPVDGSVYGYDRVTHRALCPHDHGR